jgi:4-methyl-5(b-hydroxyethyl)-thiazole monophosphate biosynthesis
MAKANVFFATGTEEVEALTVVDILRRARVETEMISTTGDICVTGSHGITVKMDKLIDDVDDSADIIVLPGGIPGVPNLLDNKQLNDIIYKYDKADGKYLAAICAAPTIYGKLGLLKGKKACCYPGMEEGLEGASVSYDSVTIDGRYITSRGLGTAIPFALAIVSKLVGEDVAQQLSKKIVYTD